jgi:ubiquinone/menaquinone biosynthesis C-methylase UbiE
MGRVHGWEMCVAAIDRRDVRKPVYVPTLAERDTTMDQDDRTFSMTFDPIAYKASTRELWQSAAEAWHRWGPTFGRWFGPATELMLDMAGIRAGSRVLDVAAGAGEQTLAAARRVGPTGFVLATDIAPNILALAAEDARQAGLTHVETREMDGEHLNFEEGVFDAAISRLGLIFFPDWRKALSGIHRVLKAGGSVAVIVFSTADKSPFFSIPIATIRRRAQLPPPLPGQPGPFSLGDPGVLEAAYRQAGFRNVRVQAVSVPLRLTSAAECAHMERESFGALHEMLSGLKEVDRVNAWQEIEAALRRFEGAGEFEAPCEVLVGAGTK